MDKYSCNNSYISLSVISSIEKTIGLYSCESGGILGKTSDKWINEFKFDCIGSEDIYIPNNDVLNIIIQKWADKGISFAGLIHSHKSRPTLSYPDVHYARKIISENGLEFVDMYLYILSGNQLLGYRVTLDAVLSLQIIYES